MSNDELENIAEGAVAAYFENSNLRTASVDLANLHNLSSQESEMIIWAIDKYADLHT